MRTLHAHDVQDTLAVTGQQTALSSIGQRPMLDSAVCASSHWPVTARVSCTSCAVRPAGDCESVLYVVRTQGSHRATLTGHGVLPAQTQAVAQLRCIGELVMDTAPLRRASQAL